MYLKLNSFFVYGLMFFCMSLIFLFFGVLAYAYMYTYFLEWILMSINSYRIGIVFLFDYYSLFFMGVVCLISGSICLYSSSYMMNESRKFYFLLVIIVFVLSMLMVICSPNLISIILGWDGLGLSSYLLVIYYQNNKSYNAGMLTILNKSFSWRNNFN